MDDGYPRPCKKVEEVEPTATSQDGINLIKSFEGLRLDSYYCASGVLTIGWGHTGPDVYEGMCITEDVATDLLKSDLHRFEQAVSELVQVSFTQAEFDATVSFSFNVGIGALQNSTFLRRINSGENKSQVFTEEFPRWNKGANGPLPGLTRRREAEVKLAVEGLFP